jgi:3-hydroxyisobutyrate dehydrogenase-like beta-hydroxyacid dehydrogenase
MAAARVGFIGLGQQGKPIAVNVVQARFDLTVFDLRSEPCQELARLGAQVAKSISEVAARSDIIEIAVAEDAQAREVALGSNGLVAACSPGQLIAIHSTIRPSTIMEIARAAKATGVDLIDAPVSGGERAARAHQLAYMVGGDDAAFARCRPIFETSGSDIFHLGPLGSGIAAKLCQQVMVILNALSTYEGTALAKAAGLAPDAFQKMIHASGAQSRIADSWADIGQSSHVMHLFDKDAGLALELGNELGVPLPSVALARQLLRMLFDLPKAEN